MGRRGIIKKLISLWERLPEPLQFFMVLPLSFFVFSIIFLFIEIIAFILFGDTIASLIFFYGFLILLYLVLPICLLMYLWKAEWRNEIKNNEQKQ